MSTPRASAGVAVLTAAGTILALGVGSPAVSGKETPPAAVSEGVRGQPAAGAFQGENSPAKVQDNRLGRNLPTRNQRREARAVDAMASWSRFGTPAMLTSTGDALASGLPAKPVAAARAFVSQHRDLLGITARAAQPAALEVLLVRPMGDGAAVLFRQRFGDLVAGYDGLLVVGIRDGKVWHVSSSLASDAAQPAAATLSAGRCPAGSDPRCRVRPRKGTAYRAGRDSDAGRLGTRGLPGCEHVARVRRGGLCVIRRRS